MPSQRLLKMLDPVGHLPARVIDSAMPVAVIWTSGANRARVAEALATVGVTPLLATSFHHVRTSLHPSARPCVEIAVIDFDVVTGPELSELVSLRWGGFAGMIVAMTTKGAIDPHTKTLVGVDAVVPPSQGELGRVVEAHLIRARERARDTRTLDHLG